MFNIRIYWKDENKKILKQQSKFTFSGIHKSYENCVRYFFKHNEVKMDLLIYLGFAKLELIKLHMSNYIMINCNLILDKKIYNYNISILMLPFWVGIQTILSGT